LIVGLGLALQPEGVVNGQASAAGKAVFPLKVSANGRYLVDQSNTPFFIHGDSPWSAIAQLPLAGEGGATATNTWDYFLTNRQAKGFNAVIVNAIENEFSATPPKDILGNLPFNAGATWWSNAFNTAEINDAYWARVDSFVAKAKTKGMAVFMNPAYYGARPASGWSAELAAAHANGWCYAYGQWLGNRYKVSAYDNIVWVLAGDHEVPAGTARDGQLAILAGLEAAAPDMLKTAHFKRTKLSLDDADYQPYMDLDAVYVNPSNGAHQGMKAYQRGERQRPSFLWEAYYEDDELLDETPADLRRFAYTAVLTGSTGHFYGQGAGRPHLSGVWPFGPDWTSKLDLPGTLDMAHVKSAFAAGNRNWWQLVPKFGAEIISSGNETVSQTSKTFISSARRNDGKLVMIYVPETTSATRQFTVNMTSLVGTPVNHRWFNPNEGTYSTAAPTCNSGCPTSKIFTTPGNNGNGKDWLLILDVGTATN